MGVPAIGVPRVGSVTRGEAAAPLSSLAFCAAMAAATNLERNGAPPDEVVVAVTPPRLGSSLSKDLCCERTGLEDCCPSAGAFRGDGTKADCRPPKSCVAVDDMAVVRVLELRSALELGVAGIFCACGRRGS